MPESDSIKIARIEQRVISMGQWQDQHTKDDEKREMESHERFDRVFQFISKGFDKIDANIDLLRKDVIPLQAERNQRLGAEGLKKTLWASGMAVLALLAGYIGGRHS